MRLMRHPMAFKRKLVPCVLQCISNASKNPSKGEFPSGFSSVFAISAIPIITQAIILLRRSREFMRLLFFFRKYINAWEKQARAMNAISVEYCVIELFRFWMLYTAIKMHWQMLVTAPALRIDLYLVRSIKKKASSN